MVNHVVTFHLALDLLCQFCVYVFDSTGNVIRDRSLAVCEQTHGQLSLRGAIPHLLCCAMAAVVSVC